MPILRALQGSFSAVNVVANRKFAEVGADPAFALDDLDLAPFFVSKAELPRRWIEYFRRHDLILSYLHDPDGAFQLNVRACGVRKFVVGPHRFAADVPATEQLARPLAPLGIPITDFRAKINFSAIEQEAIHRQGGQALIALHPGSGSPTKNWPIENWLWLIEDLLLDPMHRRVIVVGGEADDEQIAQVRGRFADGVRYAINWPLRRLAILLSSAQFVGNDSGISHLAAAAGARCLVLFGPTDPKVWVPQGDNVRLMIAPGKDLRQLTVAEVSRVLASS